MNTNAINGSDLISQQSMVGLNEASSVGKIGGETVTPEIKLETLLSASLLSETPSLPKPKVSGKSQDTIKSLSEEALMTMLGGEVRDAQKTSVTSSLKTNAQLRKSENAKIIENLQKQADKISEQKKLSTWQKIFKVIGAVVGIIAGVASIVASGGASAPLVIAACIGIGMGIESIVSEATDGKFSLGALANKMAGDKNGPWIAMGIQIALTLTSLGCGIAGIVKSAEAASTAYKVISVIQGVATGLNGTASAVTTGIKADADRDLSMLKAESKKIQAMLSEIGAEDERAVRRLREILENASSTMDKVKDIVDSSNEALSATVIA